MEDGVGSDHFDVIVVGTGIAESIAAASLARAGHSVLHLDANEYYGSRHASLTLDELVEWSHSHGATCSPSTLPDSLKELSRRYAISLFPALLPSVGPLIDKLIQSDVGKYVTFRILNGVFVANSAASTEVDGTVEFKAVPASKEAVFKDKTISLLDKRKLMKFLMMAVGDYESSESLKGKEDSSLIDVLVEDFALPPDLAKSLAYGIAYCSDDTDTAYPSIRRLNRYLRSVGRYGSSGFLVAQYGGAGEIAQAFCRSCAVYGGTYVLGEQARILSVKKAPSVEDTLDTRAVASTSARVSITIPAHPREITTSRLICPADLKAIRDLLSSPPSPAATTRYANCTAIYENRPGLLERIAAQQRSTSKSDEDEDEDEGEDNSDVLFFVLPPGKYGQAESRHAVRMLSMGPGTGCCPDEHNIVYIQVQLPSGAKADAATLQAATRPYLAMISGGESSEPSFTTFYASEVSMTEGLPSTDKDLPVTFIQHPGPHGGTPVWLEGLDFEATEAQRLVASTGLPVPETSTSPTEEAEDA